MSIGERIKQARIANCLSLRKLSELAGVSAMAISKYERNKIMPSSGVLINLSKALNVNVDFFFRQRTVPVRLQAYRKHTRLGVKAQKSIQMSIQDWVERYYAVEDLFPDEGIHSYLPLFKVSSLEEIEKTATDLRNLWNLGNDPIENFVQLLEDRRIKVGVITDYEHFDACTFKVNDTAVIITKDSLPGDRQRFNLGHELAHLILDIQGDLDVEKVANRFVGAFLVPKEKAYYELGNSRSEISVSELYLLKHKYGLSMQAWIYRAKDLSIISDSVAARLFQYFRENGWNKKEPGEDYQFEKPLRMEKLIYRALSEDLISYSRARELLAKPLVNVWELDRLEQNEFALPVGY